SWINNIFEDSKQRLWISTPVEGVYLFNRNMEKFYSYFSHLKSRDENLRDVFKVSEDIKKNIWLSTAAGHYKLNEQTNQFEKDSTSLGAYFSVTDKAGNQWLSTFSGIKFYDARSQKIYDQKNNPEHIPFFALKGSYPLIIDKQNNLWISTGYHLE